MEPAAIAPYERALRTARPLGLRTEDGRVLTLDIARWTADADRSDHGVLDRCSGPVLDVGSGPGRLVEALIRRGVPALGVDIAETAVAMTRARGVPALRRSVFDELPGEGRWPTVLLIDGNIGIGGDPVRLLRRVREVLAPGGTVVIETHRDEAVDERLRVRFTDDGAPVGPTFRWAHVGRSGLLRYAQQLDYSLDETWSSDGRAFVALGRGFARSLTTEIA